MQALCPPKYFLLASRLAGVSLNALFILMQTIVLKFSLEETLIRLRQSLTDTGLLLAQDLDYPAELLMRGLPLRHLLVLDPATIGPVAASAPAQVPAVMLLLLVQSQGPNHTTLGWNEPLATRSTLPVVATAQDTLQQQLNLILASLRREATVLGLAASAAANDDW